ncbi:uncharacterized protein DNG_05219 [Cephalotrichum gorgonifer]|uniref:Uncharacterized protein n=1 Tax=Cephalotrichum gorgonifer TaxID=2041049 RepID=A0AAE8MXI2_9PEZI|nr:uncharacterized protein DNG_05219 [Cephalotrichum gorgonifer]
MPASSNNTSLTEISAPDRRRFVIHAALLRLIEPVRGDPTRTPLDDDPKGDLLGGQQLKQKFLDSFALICSTSGSGAETASAVCLEQHEPAARAILRVARNHGLTREVLSGLEGVLRILQIVAKKEKSSMQAEPEILRLVVELDRDRIKSMAEKVWKGEFRDILREAHSKLLSGQARPEIWTKSEFRPWLEKCPFMGPSPRTWSPATMVVLVNWASQARWDYSEQFRGLLGLSRTQQPPWLNSLYKIARYHAAIKSMVKLAVKQADVFEGIQIREVKPTKPYKFHLPPEGAPLQTAVKNLVREDWAVTMEQLERRLKTHDAEAELRKACKRELTLHAEMQLVVFYEGNPSLTPRLPFIGTSKKACFLCNEYLLRHPLKLKVSACHQKIYQSWMPPPYYPAPGQFKSKPFIKLSKGIESLTKNELKTALNAPPRTKNQDSTAGPSLTITATVSIGLRS